MSLSHVAPCLPLNVALSLRVLFCRSAGIVGRAVSVDSVTTQGCAASVGVCWAIYCVALAVV
jgi:hypothetical protein